MNKAIHSALFIVALCAALDLSNAYYNRNCRWVYYWYYGWRWYCYPVRQVCPGHANCNYSWDCCTSKATLNGGYCCKRYFYRNYQRYVGCYCTQNTICSTTRKTTTPIVKTTPVMKTTPMAKTTQMATTPMMKTTPMAKTTQMTTTTPRKKTTCRKRKRTTPLPKTTKSPLTTSITNPATTKQITTMKPTTMKQTTKQMMTKLTTMQRTTTAPSERLLCPQYRLLNSEPTNECKFPGITSIERKIPNGTYISSCNAVLVNPTIAGESRLAFFASNLCRNVLDNLAIKGKQEFNFKIGNRSYPIDVGDIFEKLPDESRGASFFVIKDRYESLFNFRGTCQHPACVFRREMALQINTDDCEAVSYGSYNASDLAQKELRKKEVKIVSKALCFSKKGVPNESNFDCYSSKTGDNTFCSNDVGGGVWCKSKSNEKILMGVIAFQSNCNEDPYIGVIPYPTDGPTGG